MPRIIDVSLPIGPGLLTWPGDPSIEVSPRSRISQGDTSNVSDLRFGSHTGTHVDPPYHFLEDGATVEALPLGVLVGEAVVADLRSASRVGAQELEGLGLERGVTRLLLKTRNSEMWKQMPEQFPEDYVSVTPEGARWIVDQGIRLVGTDFLGIEARGSPGHPTHKTLLGAGVVVVEGLDLAGVDPGDYTLVCLPLRIEGGDGAPARAILIEP